VVLVLCRATTSSKVAPGTQRAASRICSQAIFGAVWPGAIRGCKRVRGRMGPLRWLPGVITIDVDLDQAIDGKMA
jgi:hypothetical protein